MHIAQRTGAFFVLFTCMMLYCAGIERHPALDSILDCIFNKKGKYKIELFGNKDGGPKTYNILVYIVISKKN